jgi:flagellar motor switch protein FliM
LGPIETNPQFAQIVPNSEMVVLVTLETRIGEVEGLMNVCMPCLTLKAVSSRLSERYLYSPVRKGSTSENAAALRGRLEGIEIPVVAKIGSLEVKMREVLSLRAGDVIRIPDSRASGPLTVTIGDRVKFTCRPGVVGKRAAVQILGKIEGVRPEEMADAAELNAG